MARKFYDITARGREYEKDGVKKFVNIPAGKLCVEDDGRMWINLEWPGMNLMLSVWEQKSRDDAPRNDYAEKRAAPSRKASDLDDDLPF